MHVSRRRFLAGSFLSASGLALAGCGGGGGTKSGGGSTSTTPTSITRAHVQSLHGQVARQLTSSGVPGTALAFTRNSFAGIGTTYAPGAPVPAVGVGNSGGGGAADSAATAATVIAPNLGGFLKNVASVAPGHRAAHIAALHTGKGRDVVPPTPGGLPTEPPPVPNPDPSFYYDYYLELWVEVTNTPTTVTYALFSDEAKTQSAGSIVTTQPTDYNTFPQVYDSSYSFTAGYLTGSHGTSKNTTNADYSFTGSYENVYSDGSGDKGGSNGTATGDFSWQSRTDTADKKWTQGAGTFRANGSGGSRFSTSDGYAANYTYNANGSGQGHITGGDPGMPVTISWDAYGNTTVQYADGSIETYHAYTDYGGTTGYGGTNGGGIADSGNASGGVTTSPEPLATPPATPLVPNPSPSPIGL